MLQKINDLQTIIGKDGVRTDKSDLVTYGKDWIKDYSPDPLAIVFPKNTNAVKELISWAIKNNHPLVPSGGRTGLSGGATATNKEVVVSLDAMNKVLSIDNVARLITAQAGTPTEKLQNAAKDNGFYFPVDFASKGSSQLGGNIATNAGGIRVIKYGGFRDWIVNLTVVTGEGEVLNLGSDLFKNQTGYDLRQLFIGSEGTLGIITEATIQLTKAPDDITRVFCALNSLEEVLSLFQKTRQRFSTLSAFELLSDSSLKNVLKFHSKLRSPVDSTGEWYVVVELETFDNSPANDEIETFFSEQIEQGTILDCAVSTSTQSANDFLLLRELISETLTSNYVVHKNDISVPLSKIPDAIKEIKTLAAKLYKDASVEIFGHVGDGNLHVNICKPKGTKEEETAFLQGSKTCDDEVFKIIQSLHGSISAEHGVGLLKKPFLHFSRTQTEINYMKKLKKIFDPNGILNPGKIFGG